MTNNVQIAFPALVGAQALHSIEEYVFKFYEAFPPMRAAYRDAPVFAELSFIIFNVSLVAFGLLCYFRYVRTNRKKARPLAWLLVMIETINIAGHSLWAALTAAYNPGLLTIVLILPLTLYLAYSLARRQPVIS